MGSVNVRRQCVFMLAVAAAITVWGSVGLYQGLNSGFSGGLYDPDYRVVGLWRGGLADRSGFKSGDRVISVEGRPVEQLGMESRWPRSLTPGIGETRRFVVERKGERVSVDVVFPPPSAAAVENRIRAGLVGLVFLVFGLWAILTVRTSPAQTLGRIGLTAGIAAAMGIGPNLGVWNGVKGHIATAADVFLFVLLLRFFVTFPVPKAVSRSRIAAWLVYGAWGCLLAFLLLELIVHPALYYTTGSVVSPLMLAYALLIFLAVIHTVVKTPRKQLRESGMCWVLGGLAISIAIFAAAFALSLRLPLWAFVAAIAVIPLTMALAVRKQARLVLA